MSVLFLEIKNLTKKYGDHTALDNVSFSLKKGEVVSLLGANGAGKSTLSSLLATLHPPTAGDILFENNSIYKQLSSYRAFLGYCPQKPNLHPLLTVEEQLYFSGSFYGLEKEKIAQNCEKYLKLFGLEKYRAYLPSKLSGGYKQRCLIARSLMHDPAFIIFDEPTVGLDQGARQGIWEVVNMVKDFGCTILLTTHYLDEAEALSDRICFIHQGKLIAIGSWQELKKLFEKESLSHLFAALTREGEE